MNRHLSKRDVKSRQGVALIVVLGFLSLMVLAAVAFLTHARMERMVADATLDAQRGRQLVRTAVNAAMNDYSFYLDQNQVIMPTAPAEELFTSRPASGAFGLGGRKIGDDGIELLVGEVEDWIPRRYMKHLVPPAQQTPDMLDGPAIVKNAQWILVREDPTRGQSRILGRYAYACFDMSGGIDANLIARDVGIAGNDARAASNRIRRTARHVPMRLLSEVADYSEFKRLRRGWQGFDSLQMLIKLTDGYRNDGTDTQPSPAAVRWQPERVEYSAGLNSNLVSDLTPFSMSAFRGGRYQPASGYWTPYVLVNHVTDWSTQLVAIAQQFEPGWKDWINKAINDYTNKSTRVPVGLDYPSPKNVPMFNEVQMGLTLAETPVDASQSTYRLTVSITPEFWFPFPATDNAVSGFFRVEDGTGAAPEVGGGVTPTASAVVWVQILPIRNPTGGVMRLRLNPGALPAPLTTLAKYSNGIPYLATSGPTNLNYVMDLVSESGDPVPPNQTVRIQGVTIRKDIFLTTALGGPKADRIPASLNFPGPPEGLSALKPDFSTGKAATDPRLNHDAAGQWVQEGPTLGQMNNWDDTKFKAEGTNLYCRNGPMETPAELGFISTGREWETIDLCTDEAVEMLATLVADTNLFYSGLRGTPRWSYTNSVFYTNGTININTRSSNVLASAFVDLSTHEVPNVDTDLIAANALNDDPEGRPDGMEIVWRLAQGILDETEDGTIDTCFHAGTDWARIPAMQQGGALWTAHDLNNNQRESLIRNTWGLFNPENSLFTIVVVAQPIKEGPVGVGLWDPNNDLITGERRAVVLAWRDPFRTGNNLHHEMFIRMFRYLND